MPKTDPPPPVREDPYHVLRHELTVALMVAGTLTIVIMFRRWTGALLGHGVLNHELVGNSDLITRMIGKIEENLDARRKEADAAAATAVRPRSRRTRLASSDERTDTDDQR